MPIYTEEEKTYDELKELQSPEYVCGTCGGNITLCWGGSFGHDYYILRCTKDINHTGISRPHHLSPADTPGFNLYDASKKRREQMANEHGTEKTKALAKYEGVVSLTKVQAKEILVAVFPDAPGTEITRAVILCATYGLNPLMKHVFLIPFNKGKSNETWATVIGIKAKRLLASRRGTYSYIDDTPRVMTPKEQEAIFGEVYTDKVMVITKVRDPATGAEAPGYGAWPKSSEPYGTEKGNSKFNMAAIRSESQALDRLRPGEMPVGVEVAPEEFIEAEYEVKEEPSPPTSQESKPEEQHWCEEHNCAFELKKGRFGEFYAHKIKGGWCNEKKRKEAEEEVPVQELGFDSDWLLDALKQVKWQDATVKSYLKNIFQVDTEGTIVEVVTRLNREQREAFFKEIQDRIQML